MTPKAVHTVDSFWCHHSTRPIEFSIFIHNCLKHPSKKQADKMGEEQRPSKASHDLRFYSATLCVIRSLLSSGVHLSVCPSVTLVDCMAEDIIKLLVQPGSPITLVFYLLTYFLAPSVIYPIPRGTPSAGAQNRRLSRKRYEIGPWLLWE